MDRYEWTDGKHGHVVDQTGLDLTGWDRASELERALGLELLRLATAYDELRRENEELKERIAQQSRIGMTVQQSYQTSQTNAELRAETAERLLAEAVEREREDQEAIRTANPYMWVQEDGHVIHRSEWSSHPAVVRALKRAR